jgi:hypothetical protein
MSKEERSIFWEIIWLGASFLLGCRNGVVGIETGYELDD